MALRGNPMTADVTAPELAVSQWFNTAEPITLAALRGQAVLLHAFQMLCPGCVAHGTPQAQRVHRLFRTDELAVIGLHTVFEHHEVMTPAALEVFLHEYRITHPVGVDTAVAGDPIPATMRAYAMQGTPTLMLVDRQGRQRLKQFGRVDDLALGAEIMRLVKE